MKTIVLTWFAIFHFTFSHSQSKITLPKYSDGVGIIFEKEQAKNFLISQVDTFFTPTIDQVESFEKSLQFLHCSNSALKKYYRQYLGFIKNNSQYLMIYFMNFKNKRLANENFKNYENEMLFGLGDFYARNAFLYRFNIQAKTIGNY